MDVGKKLLSSAIAKASTQGFDCVLYCVPESSQDIMKLCKSIGFKTVCTHGDFIKVHIMKKQTKPEIM